jgi:hypothetical protein
MAVHAAQRFPEVFAGNGLLGERVDGCQDTAHHVDRMGSERDFNCSPEGCEFLFDFGDVAVPNDFVGAYSAEAFRVM